MSIYVVDGSFPIRGKIRAGGNKNSALPCIAATVLSDEPVILKRIPDIEDVHVMFDILTHLGGEVERLGRNEYRVQVSDIKTHEIPTSLAKHIRASILFAGSLLARVGKVELPPPGGDVIGRRRLDTHFLAFTSLGVRVEVDGLFTLSTNKL
ncbi:MAG: UDP-N-acetylglucosamine 1-carboxyvinyltransferase, partial [Sediminispirochaetaceae bacterium]